MTEADLETFRIKWRLSVVERLALKSYFEAPLLARRLTPKESQERLKGWLDQNSASADKTYGEFFGDPAMAALFADEAREHADKMKKIVDELASDWERAGLK